MSGGGTAVIARISSSTFLMCVDTSPSIDKSVHLEMGIPAPGELYCSTSEIATNPLPPSLSLSLALPSWQLPRDLVKKAQPNLLRSLVLRYIHVYYM